MSGHNGIYFDLSNESYHADPAISRSGMMLFAESPYRYWANYINPDRPPKKFTPQMEFGTALHSYILEKEKFDQEYILEPVYEKLPKLVRLKDVGRPVFEAYKAAKAKIEFCNEMIFNDFDPTGKKILSLEEMNQLILMQMELLKHKEANALLKDAIYESSYFWKDKESGLMVKCRPDVLHDNIIVDLKTCASASSRAYQGAMIDGGYHIQAAIIRDGVRELAGRDIPNAINVCIETKYPYSIGIKIISEDVLAEGRRVYKQILIEMAEAINHNHFPDYEPETVELPKWYSY